MQDAINEFSGTPEEARITLANVDLALSKGQVDVALSMLRSIPPQQPCYLEAKDKMASIYLQTRKDTRLYVGCYRYRRGPAGRACPRGLVPASVCDESGMLTGQVSPQLAHSPALRTVS